MREQVVAVQAAALAAPEHDRWRPEGAHHCVVPLEQIAPSRVIHCPYRRELLNDPRPVAMVVQIQDDVWSGMASVCSQGGIPATAGPDPALPSEVEEKQGIRERALAGRAASGRLLAGAE
jgi:hypothetical protein